MEWKAENFKFLGYFDDRILTHSSCIDTPYDRPLILDIGLIGPFENAMGG